MGVSRRCQSSVVSGTIKRVKPRKTSKKDNKTTVTDTTEENPASKGLRTVKLYFQRLCDNWPLYYLVTASVFFSYWNTFFGELIHDDVFAIVQNPDILPSSSILDLFRHDYWGKPLESSLSHKSYRPLSVLSFRAHFLIHGFHPFGYRFLNVLLHVFVCLLFVNVCQRVLSCSMLFSISSGLLFAVHPIHGEAVNSAVGRADILACLFFLMAFLAYTNCIKISGKKSVDQNSNKIPSFSKWLKPCWKSLVLFNVLGAASMFSKENGITVFGFCIMYDIMVVHELHLTSLTKEVPLKIYSSLLKRIFIITSAAASLLCFRIYLQNGAIPHFTAEENPASYSELWLTRFLTYSYLCFFNVSLLLVPYNLSYDWQVGSIPLVESLMDVRNLATLAFFLGLIALFVVSSAAFVLQNSNEKKILLTGLLLLTIPFLPATNIFFTVGFVVAERILYIPSLGYCLLISFAFAKLFGIPVCNGKGNVVVNSCTTPDTRTRKLYMIVYGIFLVSLSWKTWQQSLVWQNRGTLFKAGVDAVPLNSKAHFNYANYLKDEERKTEAIYHYQEAVRLSPDHASAHNNLGTLLDDDEELAIKHFKLAIKYNPEHVNAFLNLGVLLSSVGKLNESEEYLKESYRLNPNSTKTLLVLTDIMTKNGHFDKADQVFKERILLEQELPLLNNYGLFLTKNEMFNEAVTCFTKAHVLYPEHPVPVINKANVFLALGKVKDAESTLEKFLKKRKDPSVLHHLASLHFKVLKQPAQAENIWRESLKIDPLLTEALFGYCELLKSQERKQEALSVLIHFSKFQPNSVEVLQELTNLLHDMGYLKESLETVEKLLELSERALVYYQKGNILKDLKLYQEAVTAYSHALKLNPILPEVHVNLGAAHHVLGNLDEARTYYISCLALDPDNKAAKINLGKLANTYEEL